MHVLVEPGLFTSAPVHLALVLGVVAATVSAIVGVYTVVRGQSFAGHALTDVATTGGAGATFFGLSALAGFLGGALVGAGAIETLGTERVRRRDLTTGIVLGTATGFSALFLYLTTSERTTTGATQQILFGSIFSVSSSLVPIALACGAIAVLLVLCVARALLLTSLSPELAQARGVRVRLVGFVFFGVLAISVGLSALVIGSILSTALLIGPPATALRLCRSVPRAIGVAIGIGVLCVSGGIVLAYDSFYWDRSSDGLPVSFFIVVLVFATYLLSGLSRRYRRTRRAPDNAHATVEG